MPKSSDPSGVISLSELERIALIFDRWEYAILPITSDAEEAGVEFDAEARILYDRVVTDKRRVTFRCFVSHLKTQCRKFLNKN